MKIARIETFILGTGSSKDLLFCRVETERRMSSAAARSTFAIPGR